MLMRGGRASLEGGLGAVELLVQHGAHLRRQLPPVRQLVALQDLAQLRRADLLPRLLHRSMHTSDAPPGIPRKPLVNRSPNLAI